jgi:hypothetical protein
LSDFDRRAFVAYFASAGLTSTLLSGTLWAQIKPGSRTITVAMVCEAARLAGLDWTDAECQDLAASLSSLASNVDRIDKPQYLRACQLVTAVDSLQANRRRLAIMADVAKVMATIDAVPFTTLTLDSATSLHERILRASR